MNLPLVFYSAVIEMHMCCVSTGVPDMLHEAAPGLIMQENREEMKKCVNSIKKQR